MNISGLIAKPAAKTSSGLSCFSFGVAQFKEGIYKKKSREVLAMLLVGFVLVFEAINLSGAGQLSWRRVSKSGQYHFPNHQTEHSHF